MTRRLDLMTARPRDPACRSDWAEGAGLSDQDLMERVCRGEAAAFDAIVRRYERRMVAYLIGIVGERDEALDAAQEVFVRVYTRADRYDPGSPFKAWIYRIATNVGIDLVRKRKRRRWTSLGDTLFKVGSSTRSLAASQSTPHGLSEEPPASTGNAETDILMDERAKLVRRAIETLPEKYRTAVVLRDLQELSYQDIAGVLDCSLGTVKSRVNRARNSYLAERSPGETITLEVVREGQDLTLALVLDEFPLESWLERQAKSAMEAPTASPPAAAPPAPSVPGTPSADLRWLGTEDRPFLGVRLQDLTPGLAEFFGLPEGSSGLLVEHVHEDSPAEAAGLKAGDVLVSVDGQRLQAMPQLGELLRERAIGDQVRLQWHRRGTALEASVALAARRKDIWVVGPVGPGRGGVERDAARRELETRLRALEAQRRRTETEEASIRKRLEAFLAAP